MLPSIFRLTAARVPAVLNVESFAVDENLALRRDLTDVLTVRNSGAIILNSKSVQVKHQFLICNINLCRNATTSP